MFSIGRDVNQFNKNTKLNLTRECNSDCGCKSVKLYPVCDIKGNVYYSPCHAGCRHIEVRKFKENTKSELNLKITNQNIKFKLLGKYRISKNKKYKS